MFVGVSYFFTDAQVIKISKNKYIMAKSKIPKKNSPSEAKVNWPSLENQLNEAKVLNGSALEKLIKSNQDFHMLRPEEANDKIGLALWLRVYWRKNHPEGKYAANDPSGGYPRALHKLHSWMIYNQDHSSLSNQYLKTSKK